MITRALYDINVAYNEERSEFLNAVREHSYAEN